MTKSPSTLSLPQWSLLERFLPSLLLLGAAHWKYSRTSCCSRLKSPFPDRDMFLMYVYYGSYTSTPGDQNVKHRSVSKNGGVTSPRLESTYPALFLCSTLLEFQKIGLFGT